MNRQDFYDGKLFDAYRYMGAHKDGDKIRFVTYAPRASRISIIGEFNNWKPVGGTGTHCVLSGHRGLTSAKLFTDLDKLQKGDIFLLHIYDQVFTYEIDQIRIVEPGDYGPLEIEEDKDLCTLLTCTPYGINTQRLLVRGKRIANRAGDDSRITSDAVKVNTVVVAIIISIPLLIISFIVVDMAPRRSKKKKR